MDALGRLAGMDADALTCRQQVAGQKPAIQEGQNAGVFGNVLEDLAPGHQGVDPLGPEALEIVAAGVGARCRSSPALAAASASGVEEVFNDSEAVSGQPGGVAFKVECRHRTSLR